MNIHQRSNPGGMRRKRRDFNQIRRLPVERIEICCGIKFIPEFVKYTNEEEKGEEELQ